MIRQRFRVDIYNYNACIIRTLIQNLQTLTSHYIGLYVALKEADCFTPSYDMNSTSGLSEIMLIVIEYIVDNLVSYHDECNSTECKLLSCHVGKCVVDFQLVMQSSQSVRLL
jgi:hypothetical protein